MRRIKTSFRLHVPLVLGLLGVLPLMATAPAWAADSGGAEKAAADALFQEGQRLLQAGRVEEACPKFAESQRLDPGTGTLLNLGDCHERLGKTASAWAAFNEALRRAEHKGDKVRLDEATRRAKLLEPKLSRVTIAVAPANRVPGLEVKWDGKPAGEGTWGSAIPIDPGEHMIEASAPGYKPWSGKVEVAGPGTLTAEVPRLEGAPAGEPGGPAKPLAGRDRGARTWSGQKTAGLVVGGVGAAGLIVGAVFGGLTLSKTGEAKGHCSTATTPPQCDATGLGLQRTATATAHVSTAALAIGAAAIVGGVVLFVTAPSGEKAPPVARVGVGPMVGLGTAGLSLRGEW